MDRAAFLRSLPFLRPLPPGAWDSRVLLRAGDADGDGEGEYSGSTITPPTPSKNAGATALFGDGNSNFVVSIEPIVRGGVASEGGAAESGGGEACDDDGGDDGGDGGRRPGSPSGDRKRGRDEASPADGAGASSSVGPAYFERHHPVAKKVSDGGNAEEGAALRAAGVLGGAEAADADVDRDDADARERLSINSDPTLCTFEAAMLNGPRKPTTTPSGRGGPEGRGAEEAESRALLLFRFGHRFVFQVDSSAIASVDYVPGDGEDSGDVGEASNGDGARRPAPKRQRGERGEVGGSPSSKGGRPASLLINFRSCAFRIFSMEDNSGDQSGREAAAGTDETRPSSRVWDALAKPAETIESRLTRARSLLAERVECEGSRCRGGRRRSREEDDARMAHPGSGLAFVSWPESHERSSFHAAGVEVEDCGNQEELEEEGWSRCLRREGASPAPSPLKATSPSTKASSSTSTRVEHGQKEGAGVDDDDDGGEKRDGSNDPSELTHESPDEKDKEGGDGDCPEDGDDERPRESQRSAAADDADPMEVQSSEERKSKIKDSEAMDCEEPIRDGDIPPADAVGNKAGEHTSKSDDDIQRHVDNGKKRPISTRAYSDDGLHPNIEDPRVWAAQDRYRDFEESGAHMERAISAAMSSRGGSQRQRSETAASHLTGCAEALARSYASPDELMAYAEKCEDMIGHATGEMEIALDLMFPPRGKKPAEEPYESREQTIERIEGLMGERKELVASKLALLMTPKR